MVLNAFWRSATKPTKEGWLTWSASTAAASSNHTDLLWHAGRPPLSPGGVTLANLRRNCLARADDHTLYTKGYTTTGLYCRTDCASGVFSNEDTIPFVNWRGHTACCSTLWYTCSNDWIAWDGSDIRSLRVMPSGPVAAVDFLDLTICSNLSGVHSGNCHWTGARCCWAKEQIWSHCESHTLECLFQRGSHSWRKASKIAGISAVTFDCRMTSPGWSATGSPKVRWFPCWLWMLISRPWTTTGLAASNDTSLERVQWQLWGSTSSTSAACESMRTSTFLGGSLAQSL